MSPGAKLQLNVLLGSVLLSHLGTYMVIPLIPLYLMGTKGMSVPEIGFILAVSPFTFQAGSLAGGWLSDRIGRRIVIAVGAWMNAAAIAGYALANDFYAFIGLGLLSGLGVGLNAPSTKAAIASIASQSEHVRTSAFALRGVAANVGIAAAGLLTYFVLGGATAIVFYAAAAMYVLLGGLTFAMLPKGCENAPCKSTPLSAYGSLLKNKPLMAFSAISILIWALYNQLALALPLRAESYLTDPSIVSLIWTINSFVVIALQTPLSRFVIARIHPLSSLLIGIAFIGGGLGSLYWAQSFAGLVVCGMIFIIGEMLVVPTVDATISRMATAQTMGIMFALANVSSGIGEAIGKFSGGQLLGAGATEALPWLTYGAVGAVLCAALAALRLLPAMQQATGNAVQPHRTAHEKHESDMPPFRLKDGGRSFADWFLGRKEKGK